ncbi:hypothetical protein ANCCAN_02052 [Ancylostoma caninum]|uniref:DDE Tnp4 domain-containing protein n=1 Tax=Ancylostoma caninum TaxID=29170 RepID=A0A368H507_ANCCA|nr:hypothetical protein ANCCAN_02052 [Ancylostoma caninum]
MPNDREWCRQRAAEFSRLGKFSNVIGLIDGTLVPILTPTEDGFQYMSRKGYSCPNVCTICDAVGRILYVNYGFPGSVHDSTVWRNATPGRMFANDDYIHGYCLLGDSGYANGQGIMTPFRPSSVWEETTGRKDTTESIRTFGVMWR